MLELIGKVIESGVKVLTMDELVMLRFGNLSDDIDIRKILNDASDNEFMQRDRVIKMLQDENNMLRESLGV
jgi:hypothetical protein|nr:MAG TPA: hypothetical protein [Caudoviricetes sp.]